MKHMKMLREVIGVGQDGDEAEADEEVGEPQYALAGEEDGVASDPSLVHFNVKSRRSVT